MYNFIFTSCNAFTQVRIITGTNRLFFIGIDNEIIVRSAKIPFEKFTIIINGGIPSGMNGKYYVRCSAPGSIVSIQVLYNKKIIAQKKMQVVRISDPTVYVAGDTLVTEGIISKKHLLTLDSLVVKTNVPYLSMGVTKFELKRLSNSYVVDSLQHFGYLFSPEIKRIFRNTIKGEFLVFENIYSTGPDNNSLIHEQIKLTVTD